MCCVRARALSTLPDVFLRPFILTLPAPPAVVPEERALKQ